MGTTLRNSRVELLAIIDVLLKKKREYRFPEEAPTARDFVIDAIYVEGGRPEVSGTYDEGRGEISVDDLETDALLNVVEYMYKQL